MSNAIERQREHYRNTSQRMADLESIETEHHHGISLLAGMALQYGWKSFLDVGAGSGRGINHLQKYLSDARITGVEPVDALREQGHKGGIAPEKLIEGDALALDFEAESFDVVYATGILHHIATPRPAIAEMIRVAKCAVMLSDLNNFGCGSKFQKILSHTLRALGLWKVFQWVKNGGKLDKYSDGDGVFYSYSLFDEIAWLHANGYTTHFMTTAPTRGNPFWDTSHIALLILK
jgi:ubiquinone/menaquinone biosynthesis C-methylase UbiE